MRLPVLTTKIKKYLIYKGKLIKCVLMLGLKFWVFPNAASFQLFDDS